MAVTALEEGPPQGRPAFPGPEPAAAARGGRLHGLPLLQQAEGVVEAHAGAPFREGHPGPRLEGAAQGGRAGGEVSAQVGFTSTNGFIPAFRRHFGCTPGTYARRTAEDSRSGS